MFLESSSEEDEDEEEDELELLEEEEEEEELPESKLDRNLFWRSMEERTSWIFSAIFSWELEMAPRSKCLYWIGQSPKINSC